MHRTGAIVATLALFGFAACLGFGDLQGGVDAGFDPDASGDSGATDAPNDTVNLGDSSSDAGLDAANSYCAKLGPHSFCDDFDESQDYLANGWTAGFQTSTSPLGFSYDAGLSPPVALMTMMKGLGPGNTSAARLEKQIPLATATHIHVEFDVMMCNVSMITTGAIEVFKLAFGISNGSGIDFQVEASQAYVSASGSSFPLANNLNIGAWTHVAVDIELGAVSIVTMKFDGSTVSPADAAVATSYDGGSALLLLVGIEGNSSPACTSLFDNVVMDYE